MGLVTSSVGIDENMIKTFADSGCKGLLIGFESITQESQSYINKGINKVADYAELMKKLHDYGILVQGVSPLEVMKKILLYLKELLKLLLKLRLTYLDTVFYSFP